MAGLGAFVGVFLFIYKAVQWLACKEKVILSALQKKCLLSSEEEESVIHYNTVLQSSCVQ